MRRTAPQINPGVARMYIGKGAEQVGAAFMEVGEKMHQVNVARQVASAMAQYKMRAADFMAKMQNADPSKVDFTEEYNKFFTAQGDLSSGVSRDAAGLISNRLAGYGASTYSEIKRVEIRNQTNMVLAEAPVILENLVREQAEAEMAGDTDRAERAESEYKAWLRGVAPALPPGTAIRLKNAYGDALDAARSETQKQMVYNEILAGNTDGAKILIDAAKYLTPQQKVSLTSAARAKKTQTRQMSRFQKQEFKNDQSEVLLKQMFGGGSILIPDDLHPELQPIVDAINIKVAGGMTNVTDDVSHPIEETLRHSIDDLLNVADDEDLLNAMLVLPTERVKELYEANEQTKKLQNKKIEVKQVMKMLTTATGDAKELINLFDDPDIVRILREQIDIENELLAKDIKRRFIDGDKTDDIAKDVADVFEAKRRGILEGSMMRKIKTGMNEFRRKYEKEQPTDVRRRAMINLLMSEDYERQIETAVEAGWFAIGDKPKQAVVEDRPTPIGEVPVNYIPFQDGGKFYAAPINKGQAESDAILSGLDTGNMKKFSTKEEVEKFTGQKLR